MATKIPDKAPSGLVLFWRRFNKKLPPAAFFFLALVILFLAALASIDFSIRQAPLAEGDIAPSDMVASSTILLRDTRATTLRQDNARKMQPLVLDFSFLPADRLRDRLQTILLAVNAAHSAEQREALRDELSLEFSEEVPMALIVALSTPAAQRAIIDSLLPLAESRLHAGVLPELGVGHSNPGGVMIHYVASGGEVLLPEDHGLPDIKGLMLQLSRYMNELPLPAQGKQVITLLFEKLLHPTLTPNYDLTRQRAELVVQAVEPVMYRVGKGEIIVRQGERVTREQQVKIQVLLERKEDLFHSQKFLGIVLCGLLISLGLLFSPSGKPGAKMANKDFVFLSSLLVVFSLMAKGLAAHGEQLAAMTTHFLPESLAWAVPVAGAAALSAQVFATRRYLVTGLLLAFFCTLMMDGSIGLFLFYFLTSMWSTWLTGRAGSRRDVVLSILPLTAGMLAMWLAGTLLQDGAYNRYFSEIIAVVVGAFLSMTLAFALSPVVEMVFGYTTRFRLMELLNLEQPLLRDLMLKAPGTYHHSLITSNMCEEGAKRVGAHSLLCKVAALYHDIGKVSKAGYFIENQTTEENPHNRLTPSMSALILTSHVKLGVELAKEHHLGPEITDIIGEHHGTSVIQYFYNKALNQADGAPPNIEDFRYHGSRPHSREAALVMLADIVEASSRTLADPTPTRLRQHISNIMKKVYESGQLDESELTFKDLDTLADSFQQVLRGIYHHRISYPGPSPDKAKQIYPAGQTAPPVQAAPPAQAGPSAQAAPPTQESLPAFKSGEENAQPESSLPSTEPTRVPQ